MPPQPHPRISDGQQRLLDAIDAHAAVVAPTGRIVAVNDAWCAFAERNGLSTPQFGVGVDYLELCRRSPDGVARQIAGSLDRVLAGQALAEEHEYPCHGPHEKRWFIVRVGPLVIDGTTHALVTHQNVTRLKLIEHDVRSIADGVSTSIGTNFFHSLAHCLRDALAVDGLLIDALPEPASQQRDVRTLASSGLLEPLAGGQTPLDHTLWPGILPPNAPTELSLHGASALAQDPRLGAVAGGELLAMPVLGRDAAPVGIVAALDRHRIGRPAHAANVLRIFATRVAAEIERERSDAVLRQREQELRRSEQRYRELVQQSPDGIVIAVDGVIDYLNPQALRMLGVERARDAVSRPIASFCVADHQQRLEALCRAPRGAGATPLTVHFDHHDRGEIVAEVASSTVAHHGVHAVQLFLRDVTARHEAEQQARESQKFQAVGQLAAGLAHEVNNVFTALGGQIDATEQALATGDTHRAKEQLRQIRELSGQTRSLTGSLLTYARKSPSRKAECDLAAVVKQASRLLEPSLPRTIRLDLLLTGRPIVHADAQQIHQVINNLTLNARDAIGDRAGSVRIAIAEDDRAAVLTVTDDGPGLPAGLEDHIFEPFFTTKQASEGTGLGLSVVLGIVREHDGTIEVESAPGMGTSFTIRLPLASNAGRAPAEHNTPACPPVPTAASACCLVVEDNDMVRDLAARTIRSIGHEVVAVGDGLEAHALLAQDPARFGVVLMDLNLPGASGMDVIRAARDSGYDGPVILSTGSDIINRAELPHRVSLLAKPYETSDLAAAIAAALAAVESGAS